MDTKIPEVCNDHDVAQARNSLLDDSWLEAIGCRVVPVLVALRCCTQLSRTRYDYTATAESSGILSREKDSTCHDDVHTVVKALATEGIAVAVATNDTATLCRRW